MIICISGVPIHTGVPHPAALPICAASVGAPPFGRVTLLAERVLGAGKGFSGLGGVGCERGALVGCAIVFVTQTMVVGLLCLLLWLLFLCA